jgi:membrane protein involved in colicin uptake
MDPKRKVNEQDCAKQIETDGRGNLLCRDISERLERERAEQLAREEAARKQRAAEEERLAAERRLAEAEAARKAQEERERQEKLAAEARARQEKAEAEALALRLAEQAAREAAERECRRLEQERLDGRALLVEYVDNYGKVEENKGIAGQITAFLNKPRKVKPCPPAVAMLGQPTKKK